MLAHQRVTGPSGDALTTSAAAAVKALLVAGAPKSKDIKPPYVAALSSSGKLGGTIRLNYATSDDSGKARESVVVTAGSKLLFVKKTKLRPTRADKTYFVNWNAPATAPAGELRFCVSAYDPTGHRSKPSCLVIQTK